MFCGGILKSAGSVFFTEIKGVSFLCRAFYFYCKNTPKSHAIIIFEFMILSFTKFLNYEGQYRQSSMWLHKLQATTFFPSLLAKVALFFCRNWKYGWQTSSTFKAHEISLHSQCKDCSVSLQVLFQEQLVDQILVYRCSSVYTNIQENQQPL